MTASHYFTMNFRNLLKPIIVAFMFSIGFNNHCEAGLRRDLALGILNNWGFFDEMPTSTFYQHSNFGIGIELDLRLGLSIELISLGLTGSYGASSEYGSRWDTNNKSSGGYSYSKVQQLGGAFLAYGGSGGGKESHPEIIVEYYSHTKWNITYASVDPESHYKKGDDLSGTGYGLGFGFPGKDVRIWLFYRHLTFTMARLDGLDYQWPTKSSPDHSTVWNKSLVLELGGSF